MLRGKKWFLVVFLLFVSLLLTACNGGKTKTSDTSPVVTEPEETTEPTEPTEPGTKDPVLIRVAIWWPEGDDPRYRDPVTGEYPDTMPLALREAKLKALETVLEELNVDMQFVPYSLPIEQEILQSVLAGDPVAEIVGMWGGIQHVILSQNVLQDLTPYRDLFGEEAFWLLGPMDMYGKTLGFAQWPMSGFPAWPLVYNITYLKECDTLKEKYSDEDGDVILPSQLWEEGLWDWETFRDYLAQVKKCTWDVGKIGGTRGRTVHPFEEDYRQLYNYLLAANGEYIVRPDGTLGVDSEASIEVIEFMQGLMRDNLMWAETYDDGYTPGWTWNGNNFSWGEAVFTSIHHWGLDAAVAEFTSRGEEMGIVPYPVGPKVKENPEKYKYHNIYTGGNTFGIPKGIDEETTKLAIKAWVMYNAETIKNLGYKNTQEYIEAVNKETAVKYFPITDDKYGESLLKSYNDWLASFEFDSGEMLGVVAPLHDTVAKLCANYNQDARTTIDQEMQIYENMIAGLREILEADDLVDNQAPVFEQLKELVFAVGTDLESIDWSEYFDAYDIGMDKSFSIADVEFDYSGVDNSVASNTSKLKLTGKDKYGNERIEEYTVIFFDPNDDEAPVIERVNEDEIVFNIDTNLSGINWTDYVKAYDRIYDSYPVDDGGNEIVFDLNSRLEVDLSYVDVSTPGEYTAIFKVKDYAGNETTFELTIKIVIPEQ